MRRPAVLLLSVLAAQAGAQVIRTETQEVLVDVAVTDKKGNYVQDLEASDFHVWEDGQEQKVTSFSRVTDAGPDGARPHFTILLFDNVTMSPREMAWAHEAAGNFIDVNLAPEHSMAVVNFGGVLRVAQTFTTDAPRLKQAVNSQRVAAFAFNDDDPAAAVRSQEAFAVRDTIRALGNLVEKLESLPGRKSVVFFTAGFTVSSDNVAKLNEAIDAANRSNVAIYPVNVRTLVITPDQAPTVATRGRGVRIGQSTRQLRGDPIDAVAPGQSTAASAAALQAVMFNLADGTGGFVVRQPDDTAMLGKIGQEQKEYYLLGYTPPEGSQGSCHKLRVRVERKDTEWRARKEYCNVTRGDLLSGNPVERELEAHASAEGAGNITATMQAPFFYTGPNVARVAVAMEIDTSGVNFKREKDTYKASFDILGVATRPDGTTGARFSDTVKLEFDDQKQVEEFQSTPYLYSTQLDAAPGDYQFVVVFSSGGESFGKVEMPLTIEPYQPGDFAMSSLALSTSFQRADATDAALDELLIDDSKKLIANGLQATPAGSAVVQPGAQAGFYTEIYEPLLAKPDAENPLAVAIRMRVVKRDPPTPTGDAGPDPDAVAAGPSGFDSGLMRLDLSAVAGQAVIPLLQRLPVEDLPPGPYTLEVQVLDTAGGMARRTLDFELK